MFVEIKSLFVFLLLFVIKMVVFPFHAATG